MKRMEVLPYALYLLELRDRSIFEVRNKLKLKEFSNEEIDSTIEFLLSKNYLNDERFAKNLIQRKISSGEGKYRIKIRLVRAGIDKEIIDSNLSSINSEDEYEIALEIGKKIFDRNSNLEHGKLYQKIMGSLCRKGYDLDIARRVIGEIL